MNAERKPLSADARSAWFPPCAVAILGFRVVPLLIFAAETWAALYGALRHRIPVTATSEETFSVPVVAPPDLSSLMPGGLASPPPEVTFEKRTRTVKTVSHESEMAVNLDLTVEALARGEDGVIVRAAATAGPGYCPT